MVWQRKKKSEDPDKPPTVDLIPFLSVSRSLGDYWSWNEHTQQFAVSPHPDVYIHSLDPSTQRFIILASDGLWNVMSPQDVVDFVWDYETREIRSVSLHQTRDVVRALIDEALLRWRRKGMFADNIAVVIAFLTEEGAPSLGRSSFATSSQSVESRGPHQSDDVMAAETADMTDRTAVAEQPALIHRVHTTCHGSSVYRKETLPGGALIEEHTVISLRRHHKEKGRATTEEDEEQERERPSSSLSEEERRSPVKRRREEREETVPHLPRKKIRQERDSGCESDGGSPTLESAGSLPAAEDPSSGVFTASLPPPPLSPPLLN